MRLGHRLGHRLQALDAVHHRRDGEVIRLAVLQPVRDERGALDRVRVQLLGVAQVRVHLVDVECHAVHRRGIPGDEGALVARQHLDPADRVRGQQIIAQGDVVQHGRLDLAHHAVVIVVRGGFDPGQHVRCKVGLSRAGVPGPDLAVVRAEHPEGGAISLDPHPDVVSNVAAGRGDGVAPAAIVADAPGAIVPRMLRRLIGVDADVRGEHVAAAVEHFRLARAGVHRLTEGDPGLDPTAVLATRLAQQACRHTAAARVLLVDDEAAVRLIPEILTSSLNSPLAVVNGDRLRCPQRVVGAERGCDPVGRQPGGFHRRRGGRCGADARQDDGAGHEQKSDVPASLHLYPFPLFGEVPGLRRPRRRGPGRQKAR